MSTILVTGAAGFIGSFLTETLIAHGHNVIGIDNFFRGKKENLSKLEDNAKFELITMDLSKTDCISPLKTILRTKKVDVVYHLAAINGTQYFYDYSAEVLNQNTLITANLMQAIVESDVKKIIYASSSEVYGDAITIPTPESHAIIVNSNADRDSYAISKAIGEFYVRLYATQKQMDWLVLRIFNTYGPRMVNTKYGQVIPEFIQRILSNEPFTIIGNGKHTRSFCFVKDTVKLITTLGEKTKNEFINVGNPEEITILTLAEKLHYLLQKEFHPAFLPERPHDHLRRCPDITQLQTQCGPIAFTTLEQGLKETIMFYQRYSRRQSVSTPTCQRF